MLVETVLISLMLHLVQTNLQRILGKSNTEVKDMYIKSIDLVHFQVIPKKAHSRMGFKCLIAGLSSDE